MVQPSQSNTAIIYVLSDSIGETGEVVVKAALSQFDIEQAQIRRMPYISSVGQIADALQEIKACGGMIVYTLLSPPLRSLLEQTAAEMQIIHVDILNPVLTALQCLSRQQPKYEPGLVRKIDKAYFDKMEAIEFAVRFDDGKEPAGLLKADLVLTGISRTSKTPLCVYLAHQGIKAANVPLVPSVQPPAELFRVPPHKIIGLIIKPSLLIEIRKERLKAMGLAQTTEYANLERIFAELDYATAIMHKIGCPIIDVTNKAMEETAAKLLEIYRNVTA